MRWGWLACWKGGGGGAGRQPLPGDWPLCTNRQLGAGRGGAMCWSAHLATGREVPCPSPMAAANSAFCAMVQAGEGSVYPGQVCGKKVCRQRCPPHPYQHLCGGKEAELFCNGPRGKRVAFRTSQRYWPVRAQEREAKNILLDSRVEGEHRHLAWGLLRCALHHQ